MGKFSRNFLLSLFLLAGGLSHLWADAPGIINYQGKLTDQNGNPITDNAGLPIVFSLYDVPSGGAFLFEESRTVPVDNGVFTVQIGSMTAGGIPKSIFQSNTALYLGIKVDTDLEMTPRERLVAAPYALAVATNSVGANEILDSTITLSKIDTTSFDSRYLTASPSTMTVSYSVYMATAGGKVGIGTTTPSYLLHVTTAAGVTGTVIAVSTGPVELFSVLGTSVNLKVPLVFPDGTMQTTAASGGSQWTTNGSSIGYTGAAVGIGRTDPRADLEIISSADNAALVISSGTDATQELVRVSSYGFIGIGTTFPRAHLEIKSFFPTIALADDSDNAQVFTKSGLYLNPYGNLKFNVDSLENYTLTNEAAYSMGEDMSAFGGTGNLNISAAPAGVGAVPWKTAIAVSSRAYVGIGNDFSPAYLLHVSTVAGITDTIFALSTGAVDLFRVSGTSAALQVPLYFPDGTVQTTAAGAVAAHQSTHLDGGSDKLTGSLTLTTATLTGASFSVAVSTFLVKAGKVAIGTTDPVAALHVVAPDVTDGLIAMGGTGPGGGGIGGRIILMGGSGNSNNGNGGYVTITGGAAGGIGGIGGDVYIAGGSDAGWGSGNVVLGVTQGGTVQGKIGIGTTAPAYKLDVSGSAQVTSSMTVNGSGVTTTNPVFQVVGGTLTVLGNGKVGIGTSAPDQLLTVYNAAGVGGTGIRSVTTQALGSTSGGYIGSGTVLTPSAASQRLGAFLLGGITSGSTYNNSAGIVGWSSQQWSATAAGMDMAFEVQPNDTVTGANRIEAMRIIHNGNIGIGTTTPSYRLHVSTNAGNTSTIFAVSTGTVDLFRVVGTSVVLQVPMYTSADIYKNGLAYANPDYVFEPGYNLLSLPELEKFIKKNKHLPNVPSTEDVKKDGVKMFEQNRVVLEKVEEAYLYILQLQKKIDEQNTVILRQDKRLRELEKKFN